MRILHFLTHSTIGGSQMLVSSLVRSLRDMSEHTSCGVVLPAGGPYVERFREQGFDTFTLPLASPFLWSGSVRNVIDEFAPEIVHSHERLAGIHVRRAAGPTPEYSLVHSFHGFNAFQGFPTRQLLLSVEEHFARRTDAFLCVSESEANDVHRNIAQSRGKIKVIQNCIDASRTEKDAHLRLPEDVETWFSRNASKRVISMIARPTPMKNHDLAIAAVESVLKESSQYAFLFVGLPPTDRRFRKLKKRFGHSVLAITPIATAAPVIEKSWALFLPSVREGSPLVIMEGFALGVPTIGTRVRGISDVLQDGWNGFLMDPVPEGLSQILSKVEQNSGLYQNICKGAKQQGAYLNMRTWTRQYVDVYRSLIKVPTHVS